MTVVQPAARFRCGPAVFGGGTVIASQITGTTITGRCYMPYGQGQGDLVWEAGQFGLVLAGASSAAVRVTHRVSDPAAFSSVTARLYANGFPVGAPAQFTRSMTYVSDTVTAYSGITEGNLASLTVRVTWHQVAPGLAYVQHSYATTPAPARVTAPSGINMAGIV